MPNSVDSITTPDATEGKGTDHIKRPNPYRIILRYPGALRFSAAGAIARLPMSMVGIGIVLMVQNLYLSYAIGGRVSAVYLIAQAICSPQLAKLVDRHGQARIMRPFVVVTSLSMVAMIIAAINLVPEAVLWGLAILIGSTIGSIGAMVRARWTNLISDRRELHTAYSLESAVDEFIFVVGPVVVTMLATQLHPAAGLVVPALAAGIGGWWFLSQKPTEPPARPVVSGQPRQKSVLKYPVMLLLIAIFICVGGIFGATDVSTIAFAGEVGKSYMAGIILGIFATGSLISGLGYGLRHWRSPLINRLALSMVVLSIGTVGFWFSDSLWMLAVIMFVTGFAIAPTLITGNNLVLEIVPESQLTEGLTWVATALGVGVSAGLSIAGIRIDAAGSHAGLQISIWSAGIGLVFTVIALIVVTRQRRSAASTASGSKIVADADSHTAAV